MYFTNIMYRGCFVLSFINGNIGLQEYKSKYIQM